MYIQPMNFSTDVHTYPCPCFLLPPVQISDLEPDNQDSIPFKPWEPGDAYNIDDDVWPMFQYGHQLRGWDHKNRKWYFHYSSQVDTGSTGGYTVALLVLILWFYSMYRLWLVWAHKLNFDGTPVAGSRGWDYLINWVLVKISIGKRRISRKQSTRITDVLPVSDEESLSGSCAVEKNAVQLTSGSPSGHTSFPPPPPPRPTKSAGSIVRSASWARSPPGHRSNQGVRPHGQSRPVSLDATDALPHQQTNKDAWRRFDQHTKYSSLPGTGAPPVGYLGFSTGGESLGLFTGGYPSTSISPSIYSREERSVQGPPSLLPQDDCRDFIQFESETYNQQGNLSNNQHAKYDQLTTVFQGPQNQYVHCYSREYVKLNEEIPDKDQLRPEHNCRNNVKYIERVQGPKCYQTVCGPGNSLQEDDKSPAQVKVSMERMVLIPELNRDTVTSASQETTERAEREHHDMTKEDFRKAFDNQEDLENLTVFQEYVYRQCLSTSV